MSCNGNGNGGRVRGKQAKGNHQSDGNGAASRVNILRRVGCEGRRRDEYRKDRTLAKGRQSGVWIFGRSQGRTTIRWPERRCGFVPNWETSWGSRGKSKRLVRASDIRSQALKPFWMKGFGSVDQKVEGEADGCKPEVVLEEPDQSCKADQGLPKPWGLHLMTLGHPASSST